MNEQQLSLVENMAIARDTRGVSLPAQVAQIAQLAFSPNRLTPAEYFEYRLYDSQRYDDEGRAAFLGESSYYSMIRATCDIRWWALGEDKVLGHAVLAAHGVPLPETYALYHPFRVFPGAPTLRNPEELAAFLRDGMSYPFFHKPVSGVRSEGVHLVREIDREADTVTFHDGATESVDAFCTRIHTSEGQSEGDGHLFQEVIRMHPEVVKRVGPGVSTVRVIVLVEEDGPTIAQAVWKVIGGDAIADNNWREGNLLADIDLETGTVTRLVRGRGPNMEELVDHPTTGERVVGFELPHWAEVLELTRRYSTIAHKVRFQGWDIAICEEGPKVVEFNVGSAVSLMQHARAEGFGTAMFRRFLKWAEAVNETPMKGLGRWFGRV